VSARGLVALGDSITYGHGGMQAGLGSQSWAQWLAEAMGLPYTRLAANGATAGDVARVQLARLPDEHFDVGTLYIGANDTRNLDWDAAAYARDLRLALRTLAARCDRVVVLTLPLDLGLPPAGDKVREANAAIEEEAAPVGALVVDLRAFSGPRWVWADRVHATAAGQVEIADRAARALGAPLPSRTVVDVPAPDPWYWFHYAKRAVREHARAFVATRR
jgi:lysophospholipase L1-like esterase